ncbi:MAG: FAD-binding oxidoreductase [Chloroflexi bacterium]|nr:FAD-binding oxidoreductase [Chloroflexota bacterium]
MVETADVVIVGCGIIGSSLAYHLRRRSGLRVVVLERTGIGQGSTTRCNGGVRLQFATEINIQLSLLSVPVFEHFEAEFGVDPEFRQFGYLMLATTPERWETFRRNAELQRARGVPVELLGPREAAKIVPGMYVDDVLGATYCPRDGYADPTIVLDGIVRRARGLGAEIREDTPATGIRVEGGRVTAVETPSGTIATRIVVNAAGPYAAAVGELAGVEVPVRPFKRQMFLTGELSEAVMPARLPLTVDFEVGFSVRRYGPAIGLGMSDRGQEYSFETNADWDFLGRALDRFVYRWPALGNAQITHGWAGLYEVSPDNHPILGCVPEVEGFLCGNGFSGHGFMHGPVAGQLLAELILDGEAKTLDINPLSIRRFQTGELIRETQFI